MQSEARCISDPWRGGQVWPTSSPYFSQLTHIAPLTYAPKTATHFVRIVVDFCVIRISQHGKVLYKTPEQYMYKNQMVKVKNTRPIPCSELTCRQKSIALTAFRQYCCRRFIFFSYIFINTLSLFDFSHLLTQLFQKVMYASIKSTGSRKREERVVKCGMQRCVAGQEDPGPRRRVLAARRPAPLTPRLDTTRLTTPTFTRNVSTTVFFEIRISQQLNSAIRTRPILI